MSECVWRQCPLFVHIQEEQRVCSSVRRCCRMILFCSFCVCSAVPVWRMSHAKDAVAVCSECPTAPA